MKKYVADVFVTVGFEAGVIEAATEKEAIEKIKKKVNSELGDHDIVDFNVEYITEE